MDIPKDENPFHMVHVVHKLRVTCYIQTLITRDMQQLN